MASNIATTATLAAVIGLAGCNRSKTSSESSTDGRGNTTPQASNPGASLEGFEGEIGILIKPGPGSHNPTPIGPLTVQVKAGKIRVDAPANLEAMKGIGRAYVVVAALEKKIFAVLDDKRAVVQLQIDKLGEQIKRMKPPASREEPAPAAKPAPKITKTGHKDTVAGQSCEDWEVASDGSKAVICVAERGVPWLKLPTLNAPAEHAWIGELLDGKHFPIRLIAFEKDGRESGRVELTKLEQKTLPAGLFEMPMGYRTLELEQAVQELMMAGMGLRGMPTMPSGMAAPSAMPNMAYRLPPELAARLKAARDQAATRQKPK